MKKTLLAALTIAAFMPCRSIAQSNGNFVTSGKPLARIDQAKNENNSSTIVRLGTIETAKTSREQVLAYPRLLPQALDCEVTGYDFAMVANGKSWGPITIKGAVLNEEIKDKIKAQDPSNVKISITNIHVKCGSEEATAKPVSIEYNH